MSHKTSNKLSNRIINLKDKISTEQQYNVVYRINCNGCNNVYIGETGRNLITRINEHKQDLLKKKQLSQLYQHANSTSHNFNFDNTLERHRENNTKYRKMLEAFYSHNSAYSINRAIDIPEQIIPLIEDSSFN